MKTVCLLVLLLSAIFQASAAEPECKQVGWTVYIEDGKSLPKQVDLLPATTPLENYRENLVRISPEMDIRFDVSNPGRTPSQNRPYDEQFLTVTKLGPWHDYVVFDVSNDDARHRSIIMKDNLGNHRILYTQTWFSTVAESPQPHFVDIDGRRLLVYRAPVGGTGNFHIEYYFLFDEDTRLPVPLNLDVIDQRLATLLPEGRAVWKGGGFDIESLTYSSPVWQEGDGNCCPSAGRVTMQLNIEENELVVTDAQYDPDAKGPRQK